MLAEVTEQYQNQTGLDPVEVIHQNHLLLEDLAVAGHLGQEAGVIRRMG